MSRFRKALAAAAMAVATAGGGLLATAAAAAPAHAATAPAPAPASRTFSFTAVPAAQAAGGSGPRFQCGETCDPNGGGNPPPPPLTITCTIHADTPTQSSSGLLAFSADTVCDGDVARISMGQDVIHPPNIPDGPLTDSDVVTNYHFATTQNLANCTTGQWAVSASAYITPPAGWVIIAGHNPIVDTSPTVTFNCGGSGGGGGGGGGGCATGTPPVPAQPAARQPDVISCP